MRREQRPLIVFITYLKDQYSLLILPQSTVKLYNSTHKTTTPMTKVHLISYTSTSAFVNFLQDKHATTMQSHSLTLKSKG